MYFEMRRFQSSFTILLVAVLVLTAQSMAVARGTAMSAGQTILCTGTGTGPVTVDVDKNGQPVRPTHICPDCALSELVAVDEPAFLPAEPLAVSALQWRGQTITMISALRHSASARDPPLV